jgi:sarcosine oxidase
VHLGVEGLHYGLPTFDGRMKAAWHGTGTGDDDPDRVVPPDPAELARVEARLRDWFNPGPGPRLGAHTCFYTNAPGDALHVGPAPGYTRVCAVTACSGHAFKLAPLTGEAAAEWVVGG